ncbi:hypothetical protein [Palleronia abyssalis]|uniref:Methyl-accepting transducer domain-containing protein n=1 Tax=Palleronia abyssalis TaxID=1501240 RepID=A0A2R8BTU5_9RHOB|nr:hypothetical protein [Palleronia abyssalis]SPJ23597.1 hypothetical protein PAA8504_01410 [Palleronia abyssalis]
MTVHVSLDNNLERLATEISGAFSVAFFELETIRDAAKEFAASVEELLTAIAPSETRESAGGTFQAFLSNASSAAGAAESAAGSLTDREFQGALIRISGSLMEMKKHTVTLTTISYLTKITQTGVDESVARLNSFTETLDSRCVELQEAALRSTELVRETQRQSGLARDRLTTIGLEFRALSDSTMEESAKLDALEKAHHAHMARVRDDAHRLDADVRRSVAGLIGCLQFPDSFAQRAEHMRTAIAALGKTAPDEAPALAKVVSAQLMAMSKSLSEVCSSAKESLLSLKGSLEQNPVIFERREATNPSDEWMSASSRANEQMLDSVARAREQFDAALKLLHGLAVHIDETQENLESAVRLNAELETSVHNASVVAHRIGSQTSPLKFLAGSVKDVVDETSTLIHNVTGALSHIKKTSQALAECSLNRDLETLVELQGAAASEGARQSETIDHVRTVRRKLLALADRLDGASAAASHSFEAAAEQAASVAELATSLPPPSSTEVVTSADLTWLYDTYTMDEERVVHRDALGLPEQSESEAVADEDLDDFML